ncbi:low affinity iron permease family protein [Dyadobacter bucti]|uniref:low affinity iron permease family protein n=1 Tax=Dyadobacter bucti TaxID=2572203 RepID=UPI001108DF65|nr:low affinity iron permease family protein [Dyadobacter bucti]
MKDKLNRIFEQMANLVTCWAGSSAAFLTAFIVVLIWAATGPVFGYSETWQLVINTGTTIVTFLMVFIIQKSQNKESKAIQLKLNELIAASRFASNRMVDIEDLTEDELNVLHKFYKRLSDQSELDQDIHKSHSIDAAEDLQKEKEQVRAQRNIDPDPS